MMQSNDGKFLLDSINESIFALNTPKGRLFAYVPDSEFAEHSISKDHTKIAVCNNSLCITVYDLLRETKRVCSCDKMFSLGSWALSESGNNLLISSAAGDAFSINLKSAEIELAWKTTNARDIWMCDFSNAIIMGDRHFTDVLKLNGAITDTPLE